jgi:hypothetical protein
MQHNKVIDVVAEICVHLLVVVGITCQKKTRIRGLASSAAMTKVNTPETITVLQKIIHKRNKYSHVKPRHVCII